MASCNQQPGAGPGYGGAASRTLQFGQGDKLTVATKPKPGETEMMAGLLLHFSLANLRVFTLRQAYYHTEDEWE
jgi:hypothetical protein